MSVRVTLATARRVLEQLRGDHRTVALLMVVPCVLMALLYWVFDGQPETFDRVGLMLLGRVPVRDDVPGHERRDAAGAHERHARTAAHDAAREARPAARLRARVRGGGADPGDARAAPGARAARARPGGVDRARAAVRGGQRRAGHGARPAGERVRPERVPGGAIPARVRAPAAAAVRADRAARPDGGRAGGDQRGVADDLRCRRDERARAHLRAERRPARGPAGGRAAARRPRWRLGAGTLRRRTA